MRLSLFEHENSLTIPDVILALPCLQAAVVDYIGLLSFFTSGCATYPRIPYTPLATYLMTRKMGLPPTDGCGR
jgi:hypothetical protein